MSKRTVFSMLDTAVLKYPNDPYLSSKGDKGWIRTSFKEAQIKSRRLASAFLELGLKKGDKAAILSEAKTDWIISEFAALYAGGVSVPLSIKLLPEEVPFRVNHSDSSIFLISENTLEKVISQWDAYKNKELKLILLDKPSEKISKQCTQYGFEEGNLFYIDDLYELGEAKLSSNESALRKIEEDTEEDQVVTISYTSGTTGNPKGIMLTHLNYHSNSHAAVSTFQIKENISTLLILPTDHSFAHTVGIYTALVKGLSLHFVDARGGSVNALKNIPKNLIEAESNFLLTVPALTSNFIQKFKDGIRAKGPFIEGIFNRGVEAAIQRNGDGFSKPGIGIQTATWLNATLAEKLIFNKLRRIFGPKIEFFVGGGALLDIKQQQFYKAIGIPVYQGYGLTEATPIISTNTPFNHKMGTSGKVLQGIECKICDDSGKELPKGEKGEIVIKGDNVMKGYYKNESATKETIKNGWLHTGDLGFMDEDEFLVVVGREKALLISEDGEKYSPEEIEEAIVNSAECIDQIMIYNDHEKYTTALVTINKKALEELVKSEGLTSYEVINKRLKEDMLSFSRQKEFEGKFPGKWIPSNFQVLEEPFTEENKMINSTLKMVRHKITETYRERLDMMYGGKANDKALTENIKRLKKIVPIP
ncbi:MAG: AMP-binding protein [Flavobacteriaceae bacterium]|nr:MAG: AMP-binding protein [Flavobacteriaceae bacterium]